MFKIGSKPERSSHFGVAADRNVRAPLALALGLLIFVTGCQTHDFAEFAQAEAMATNAPPVKAESIVLHEGDLVRVTFPGAPNLNTTPQPIRRDGRLALPLIGEVQAAGLTPSAMEQELIKLYGPQLQVKEVSVTVESSAFPIYVTGAVLRPGKITSDRPLTALEGIMEAGGFDYTKANLKRVTVIRHENGQVEHYKLNLKGVLQGEQGEAFNLKPHDIIYVPERLSWF